MSTSPPPKIDTKRHLNTHDHTYIGILKKVKLAETQDPSATAPAQNPITLLKVALHQLHSTSQLFTIKHLFESAIDSDCALKRFGACMNHVRIGLSVGSYKDILSYKNTPHTHTDILSALVSRLGILNVDKQLIIQALELFENNTPVEPLSSQTLELDYLIGKLTSLKLKTKKDLKTVVKDLFEVFSSYEKMLKLFGYLNQKIIFSSETTQYIMNVKTLGFDPSLMLYTLLDSDVQFKASDFIEALKKYRQNQPVTPLKMISTIEDIKHLLSKLDSNAKPYKYAKELAIVFNSYEKIFKLCAYIHAIVNLPNSAIRTILNSPNVGVIGETNPFETLIWVVLKPLLPQDVKVTPPQLLQAVKMYENNDVVTPLTHFIKPVGCNQQFDNESQAAEHISKLLHSRYGHLTDSTRAQDDQILTLLRELLSSIPIHLNRHTINRKLLLLLHGDKNSPYTTDVLTRLILKHNSSSN